MIFKERWRQKEARLRRASKLGQAFEWRLMPVIGERQTRDREGQRKKQGQAETQDRERKKQGEAETRKRERERGGDRQESIVVDWNCGGVYCCWCGRFDVPVAVAVAAAADGVVVFCITVLFFCCTFVS